MKNHSLVTMSGIDEARQTVWDQLSKGRTVGLVPTMGALHAGHLSLVEEAREVCDWVITTIFVNPTQFGPNEDLSRYPRTWDADVAALKEAKCDAIFAPDVETMYPSDASTVVQPPSIGETLEGEFRPSHFGGVATIVLKLFQILPADVAFFGQKDFQQFAVIRDMVRDLNMPIQLAICPTIRESDGLAMSSRNRFLSPEERQQAVSLSIGLRVAQKIVMEQPDCGAQEIEAAVEATLRAAGIERIDYVAVRDCQTLQPLTHIDGPFVLLIAAYVGETRLIDNALLNTESINA